jgi:hypothetical protein
VRFGILSDPRITSALVGFGNPGQLQEVLAGGVCGTGPGTDGESEVS